MTEIDQLTEPILEEAQKQAELGIKNNDASCVGRSVILLGRVTGSMDKRLVNIDEQLGVVSEQMKMIIVPAMQKLDDRMNKSNVKSCSIFELGKGSWKVKVAGVGGAFLFLATLCACVYCYHMKLQGQIEGLRVSRAAPVATTSP